MVMSSTVKYSTLPCFLFQEGISVGRTFAALKNYQVDGNKEMMAIGLMNMAGSCSSCFVTTGEVLIFFWWLCDSEIF